MGQTTTRKTNDQFKIMRLGLFILLIALTSCRQINCDDPYKSYEYWAGQKAPRTLKVINGQYWQSPHFTLEYILYLQVRPTKSWWTSFIKENNFVPDTNQWTPNDDAPKWFNPPKTCLKWKTADDFQGSRLLQDTVTKECYIYLIQL
jgi:hypothetical protein